MKDALYRVQKMKATVYHVQTVKGCAEMRATVYYLQKTKDSGYHVHKMMCRK